MKPVLALRIVVVEDYLILQEELVLHLNEEGFSAKGVNCGEALDELLEQESADMLVLDLNLPHEDGISIAKRMRRTMPEIGIIMLTARTRGSNKIQGYEAGADLYLTKPVPPEELTAAIHALKRRLHILPELSKPTWQLDVRSASLQTPSGQRIELTVNEAHLLRWLAMAPEQSLEIHELLSCLDQIADENSKARLEVLISRLRKKLGTYAEGVPVIKAIWGRGYQLCLPIQVKP